MASSNPAFNRSPAFGGSDSKAAELFHQRPVADLSADQLSEIYSRPSATASETDRMTYEDTVVKTVISFVFLLVGAAVGWVFPLLAIPAAIVGFVLALVNIFKKKPSPALVLSYAAVQGIFVGGITVFFERQAPGIAFQAVIGTFSVVGVTLALFASGKIRASAKATKIFLIAMVGYAVFSLVNFGLMAFGVNDEPFGLRSATIGGIPIGLILGVLVVIMAAYSLVLDFDSIQQGVRRGAPRVYAWAGAFGIMMTVIWLYLEILRMLSILRGNN